MIKLTKIKKVYAHELVNRYIKIAGLEPNSELDYRLRFFFERLCDGGIYEFNYSEKPKAKWRITFPIFIAVILLAVLFGAVRWLFTGVPNYDSKSWFVRTLVKWDRVCNFNIL